VRMFWCSNGVAVHQGYGVFLDAMRLYTM